jgi:hypothetical protein
MNPLYPELQKHSPVRRPEWRWRRARVLVERHQYFSPRRDDDATGRAVGYMQRLGRSTRTHSAKKHFPDIEVAHGLYREGGAMRVLLEARILARQSPSEIARVTELPSEVIVTYEALFFNVLDRLDAYGWIQARAIGNPAPGQAPSSEMALKAFAYNGGPLVLDLAIPYLIGGKKLFDAPPDLSNPEGRLQQSVQLALAMYMLPFGQKIDERLSRIMLLLIETACLRPKVDQNAAHLEKMFEFRPPEAISDAKTSAASAENHTTETTAIGSEAQVA